MPLWLRVFRTSLFVVFAHCFAPTLSFWPHINIEMRNMHKSLHRHYAVPPFSLFNRIDGALFLFFSRWLGQHGPFLTTSPLIFFRVLFSFSATQGSSLSSYPSQRLIPSIIYNQLLIVYSTKNIYRQHFLIICCTKMRWPDAPRNSLYVGFLL